MAKIKNQKSKTSNIHIDHTAKLANLSLTEKEKKIFNKQLQEVLSYVSQLNKLNTEKIEPIGHITGLSNVTRDDAASSSISQEEALKNARKTHNGFFEVKAIFEEQ